MKPHRAFAASLLAVFQTVTFAAKPPEYVDSFDSAKGFKPAQDNLTKVFLQIAGSLEFYGTPEPYLRHMAKEHARIENLYFRKNGTQPKSYRPAYMTDEYIDRLAANWNLLSPKLGLEPYAKEVGNMMRDAIKGTRGTGTILIDIFNEQQSRIFDRMAGKQSKSSDFEALKAQLVTRLELNNTSVDVLKFDLAHRDAVTSALGIHGATMKLFKRLDDGLKPEDAERVKTVITSIFMNVGQMAQSELEASIAEWALKAASATPENKADVYNAGSETRLTAAERKQFAGFLGKDRFTRGDFDGKRPPKRL